MSRKSIVDALTYTYIRKIKKWMFCPACQNGKMTINRKSTVWTCEECEYKLSADEYEDNYVFWFCDECNAYLNNQNGFDRRASFHICQKCGYKNDTTFDNVKGICSDCGKVIPDPDGTLCIDCKQARKTRAKEWLMSVGKAVGAAVVVAGATYLASQSTSDDDGVDYKYHREGDNAEERISDLRCANCGNVDKNTLWDEGDTIYCSRCAHRTNRNTGEDDVVECPYCHRMRDRKALYCRWCNDSTWEPSTPDEFEETDKILKELGH